MKTRCKTGFTLVELLVVIAIIGIIIAITLPALGSAVRRSRELQCLANIREANTIATAWSHDHRDLPPHFKTNPILTDSIGVPLIDIPHMRFTATMNYFNQTTLWIRAIRPPSNPVDRSLTCTGAEPAMSRDPDDFAWTSYDLSAALLADPSVFTPETAASFTPEMFRPQPLTSVFFPSTKSFLAEQKLAHFDGEFHDPLELKVPTSPVSFVDGHASIRSFNGIASIEVLADGHSPRPFSHTIRGVRGFDTQAIQ